MTAKATANLDTFAKWLQHNAAIRPSRPAMRHKDLGIWKEWSWAEVARIVQAYSLGLMAHGLQRGDKIAIIGTNRPKLYWSIMAAQSIGAACQCQFTPTPSRTRWLNHEISNMIAQQLDLQIVLTRASKHWDGGYTICGAIGHGDGFVMRDPHGIRPAYYYHSDEIAVVASERPAMLTAFTMPIEDIKELKPGHALIIKVDGRIQEVLCRAPKERKSCSFERIYFSRGSDPVIYNERKELGRRLCPGILEAVNYDLKHTVFSFIPNTAEVAFLMMCGAL